MIKGASVDNVLSSKKMNKKKRKKSYDLHELEVRNSGEGAGE